MSALTRTLGIPEGRRLAILWLGLSPAFHEYHCTLESFKDDGFGPSALYVDQWTGFCGSVAEWADYRADMVEREAEDHAQWVAAMEEQDHHDWSISVMCGIPMF